METWFPLLRAKISCKPATKRLKRPPEVMDVLDVSWIYIIYQMFLKFEFSDCIQCKYVYIYIPCVYIYTYKHNMHVETSHNHHRSGFRNWGRIFYPFLSFLCWNHAGWRFLVQICPIIRWHELEWMRHSHEVRIAEFLSNRYLNPMIGIWQLPVPENQWHGSDFCPPFCLYGCNNLLKDRNLYDDNDRIHIWMTMFRGFPYQTTRRVCNCVLAGFWYSNISANRFKLYNRTIIFAKTNKKISLSPPQKILLNIFLAYSGLSPWVLFWVSRPYLLHIHCWTS